MADKKKYRNVSLSHQVHGKKKYLSKVLLPGTKLSISKTIETIANSCQKGINKKELGQDIGLNIENIS